MGQACGPGAICDIEQVHGHDRRSSSTVSWNSYASAQAQALSSEEAARKMDQLGLELRMLKDDNYRIREEQLRLEKELKDTAWRGGGGGGRGAAGGRALAFRDPRVDPEQQLTYMQELIRSLQAENVRLRASAHSTPVGTGNGRDAGMSGQEAPVSEEDYQQLQRKLARLQQSHSQQQQARRMQAQAAGRNGLSPGFSGGGGAGFGGGGLRGTSAVASTAASGAVTPAGSSPPSRPGCGGGQDPRGLQAQYEALMREQEQLRGKVRKLAQSGG